MNGNKLTLGLFGYFTGTLKISTAKQYPYAGEYSKKSVVTSNLTLREVTGQP